ncbi:ino eighty subunit 1 [Sporothrix brasiliensis 5110]|uniref:Ino eighty subunit 1 n=1 Tax=Sporothrix brasiliensis 5110 TaxID=1398154 RepID=A0A0C2F6C6_9PEZI|nr:ino eighty subunit 1 [Sporothrix brasiliensis 5110]KIH94494.1 ino eighty subunit 1 [Sporothrix brasiliensis 5110]
MASPSSAMSTTEVEPQTSPAPNDKSFAANAANLTEDDASDRENGTPRNTSRNTSRMIDTPDISERRGGAGSGRGRGRGGRDSSAAGGANGAGGPGVFKDPSAIGKIRHLKKEDGEPLWRVDIQYDFLRAVFADEHCVFTNSYEPDTMPKQCFADLYIDTMARSSKTSKILHDKLLTDREAAKNMAMIHEKPQDYKQLQDAPRLKSILKGGTEDRAEPRSLDLLKDMDVPRTNPVNLLFLICNNASKVAELHFPPGREFHDLIMKTNLTSASRARAFLWVVWFYLESDFTEEGCEENPFGPGVDYGVDVANQGVPVMEEMTPEQEKQENIDTMVEIAFGTSKKQLRSLILQDEHFIDMASQKRSSRPSRPSAAATAAAAARDAAAVKESAAELAGTDNERSLPPAILPRIRPSKHESDVESMRSTPPPRSLIRSFGGGAAAGSARRGGPHKFSLGDGGGGPSPVRQPPLIQQLHQQQQMQQTRRKRKSAKPDGRSSRHRRDDDDDDGDDDDVRANTSLAPSRKPRPPTAHQIAVENNRKQRIEYLLSRGMHRKHHRSRKTRRTEGAIVRALRRLDEVEDPFENSEDESNLAFNRELFTFTMGAPQSMATGTAFRERGFHGLVQIKTEPEDFGEEVSAYASAMRRACRRLNRWETDGMAKNMVVPTIKRPRVNVPAVEDEYRDPNETEEEQDLDQPGGDADASMSMSFVETTPVPAAKKRRAADATGQVPAVAALSRARGGRVSSGRVPSNTPAAISARRRRAAKAAALLASSGGGDVATRDAGGRNGSAGIGADDAGGEDTTVLASGAEGEGDADNDVDAAEGADGADGADDTEDVASVSAAPVNKTRVTIKKKTSGAPARGSSRAAKVKREDEGGDEAANGAGGGEDDEDELNDVDKALLGMGSDSE